MIAKFDARLGRKVAAICVVTAALLSCASISADELRGAVVQSNGKPLAGALVTARAAKGIETTVYSATDGSFVISGLAIGTYTVRARFPGQNDTETDASSGTKSLSIQMRPAADPLAHAPTSTWLSLLPDGDMKYEFILNCATCHEINKEMLWKGGMLLDKEEWAHVISLMKKMDVYSVVPPNFDTDVYATWLADNLNEVTVSRLVPPTPAAAVLADRVRITEYPLPKTGELPHDLVIGPDDRIWVTAFWHSEIWALEPATGHWESFDVSETKDAPAQVRALQFDQQGMLWMVNGGTQSIVRLDPATGEFTTFPVGIYAHDLVIDSSGDIWINDYFSKPERIERLSAKTGEVSVHPLPSSMLPDSEGKPLPYGMQIDAQDRLWSTQLAANTLVRFDTRTEQSKLYQMPEPNSGPRRNAIGIDGSIWIPEFNTGMLTRFDPATEKFERNDLGDSALGPYDVEVDPRSGAVWIAGSLGTMMLRFDPQTKAIEQYPLPTEPAYMRHLAVDSRTGAVWSTYSSLPTAKPKVVRLERTE